MRKDLDNELCRRFPSIFVDRNGNPRQTAMHWGFPEDGWYQLIYNLCLRLERVNPDAIAVQVKEKFGGLRFYAVNSNEDGQRAIAAAENASYCICEWCGRAGTSVGSGSWVRTLCEKCRTKERKGWKPWCGWWEKYWVLRKARRWFG